MLQPKRTICSKEKRMVGARIARPQAPASRSEYGVVIEGAIQKIAEQYPCISVPNYVVMPNHIHMILVVANDGGRAMRAPTAVKALGAIIVAFHSTASNKYKHRSFCFQMPA